MPEQSERILRESILSAEDSRAKTLAESGRGLESMEREAGYGQSLSGSFASYDPVLFCWRTSQVCLTGELAEFSGTWPKSGLMRNGRCFQRGPLVDLTTESEFSLWPTPGANDYKGSFKWGQRRWQLDEAVENMPPWVECLCCGEFLCTIHLEHAHECECAPIEEWSKDPYMDRAGGRLAPQFSEWLMGFPAGWTDLNHSETPLPHRLPNGSAGASLRQELPHEN